MTSYYAVDVIGIVPPKTVDGVTRDPMDGVSMKYTFADAKAAGRKRHGTSK
jgi:arylsulfatase